MFRIPLPYHFPIPSISITQAISYALIFHSITPRSVIPRFTAQLWEPVCASRSPTPGIRAGATGSVDMASAAVVYAGTLTSNYKIPFDAFELNIGNMIGTTRTGSVSWGSDFDIDYDLNNIVYKNGISFEGETRQKLLALPTSWQVSLANTLITGDDVFIDNYWDFSFSWGARKQANNGVWNNLRLGTTLTIGHDYRGGI